MEKKRKCSIGINNNCSLNQFNQQTSNKFISGTGGGGGGCWRRQYKW